MTTTDRPMARARWTRRVAPLAALISAAALIVSPMSAMAATPYGSNLVKNAGAQDGSASSSGNGVVDIPRWSTFANMTVVKYGTTGFPSKSKGNAINGGTKFFSAGKFDPGLGQCGQAEQVITLSGRNSLIDSGKIKVSFSGKVAASGPAVAHLDLYFRDANNHGVGTNGIQKKVSGSGMTFKSISASRKLPKGTRQLRVKLWADGVDSGYCKAFFDNIKVTISQAS